jgi:hypothetical protein
VSHKRPGRAVSFWKKALDIPRMSFFFFFFFCGAGDVVRASCRLGTCSNTELHTQPNLFCEIAQKTASSIQFIKGHKLYLSPKLSPQTSDLAFDGKQEKPPAQDLGSLTVASDTGVLRKGGPSWLTELMAVADVISTS